MNSNETAMEVILHAGNGRLKIDEAFEKMAQKIVELKSSVDQEKKCKCNIY